MTLPQGWAETTIEDVSAINPKHSPNIDRTQPVSFVPMPAVDGHLGAITGATDRALNEVWTGFTHFADGDVIFAKITPCMENGKAAVVRGMTNGLACGSTEFFVMRPEDDVSPDFLWRMVRQRSFRSDAEQNMSGAVGQRRVPRPYLEGHSLPLPPSAEQRRIVAKLDALTARLAHAQAELDRVPVLGRRMLDAAYADAFDDVERGATLSSLTPSDAPIIYGILQPGPDTPGGVPYVRPTEIDGGEIKLEEVRRTTEAIAHQYRRATIRTGDVILSIVGTIGKVAVVPEALNGGNITQSSCRIRPDAAKLDRGYLRHWLRSPSAWRQYDAGRLGTAVPRLNIGDIREFVVPLVSLPEQAVIARRLDAVERRASRMTGEATRARALIDRLEAAILARAFRGELVPQDPADEPASVLLDRIRVERSKAGTSRRPKR